MAFTVNTPAGVANPSPINRAFVSDLQMLVPHYYDQFVARYGNENYTWLLEAIGLKQRITGRDFFHFESYGKLHASIRVNAQVTPSGAGDAVTVTLSASDHYNSGTESPIRVNEVVRIDSSGIEGKITAVNKTTPNAHTATILPLKTTDTFASAGSSNLLAGEILLFRGDTEAGENSTQIDGITNLTEKFTNTTTEIRDDWSITDRALMEQIFVEFDGMPYYTYKGLHDMVQRFANTKEFKLMSGDVANNLASNGGSVGTQGLIPRVEDDGQSVQYTPGQLTIAKIQEITRGLDWYGGAQEYHWLCDNYQYDELMNQLFQTYNGGAIIWDFAGKSQEAAVAYGFSSLALGQGYNIHFKKYRPFNSEAVYGRASANSQFRNYGILIPMKQWDDPVQKTKIPTMRVMYQAAEGKPEIVSVDTGMFARTPTNNNANLVITNLCYAGLEVFAANQFVIVSP